MVGTLATRLRSSLGVLKSVCLGLGVCCSAGRGAQAAGEQVGEGGGLRQQRLQSGIASDGVAAATGRILVNALRPQTQQEQRRCGGRGTGVLVVLPGVFTRELRVGADLGSVLLQVLVQRVAVLWRRRPASNKRFFFGGGGRVRGEEKER